MVRDVGERHAKVVEAIGHTMGEAAHNEQRDTKNQGQHLVLTGKSDSRGHDEPTADAQHTTPQSAHGQTAFQDALCSFLQRKGAATRHQSHQGTAHQIEEENEEKRAQLAPADESGRAGVEFQGIMDHCGQSEGKKDSAHAVLARGQITETGRANGDAGEDGRRDD